MNRLRAPAILGVAALLVTAPVISFPAWGATTPDRLSRYSLGSQQVQDLAEAGVTAGAGPLARADSASSTTPLTAGAQDDVVVTVPIAAGGLVGVTWPTGTSQLPAQMAIRTLGSAGWSEWGSVDIDNMTDSPASGPQRPGTEALWGGADARSVQIRVGATSRRVLSRGELAVMTPGQSPQATTPPARAVGASVTPTIITRAQWGADESLRKGCVPDVADTTRAAIVHHTDGVNGYTAAESAGIVRGILAYHTSVRGWCDIGYNALIDAYGQIFEGRIGGLTNPVVGAHTLGFNYETFGVSVMGDYTTTPASAAALESLANVIAMRFHDFYLDPTTTTTLTSRDSGSRYPAGTVVTLPRITGHRDLNLTACPGDALYAQLASLREKVRAKVNFTDSPLYAHYRALGGRAVMGEVSAGETTVFGHRHVGYSSGWGTWSRADGSLLDLGPGFDRALAAWGDASWGDPRPELAVPGGVEVTFTGTSTMLVWSAKYGTGLVRGAVRSYWEANGGLTSWIGFPVENETVRAGGVYQQFSFARVSWSAATGPHATYGAIGAAYAAAGSIDLGFPVTEEIALGPSASWQRFERGAIGWSATTGARVVTEPLLTRWLTGGGVDWLGLPTSGLEQTSPVGTGQDFVRGSIYQSKTTPALALYRGLHAVYAWAGGPGGCLGYPTSEESAPVAGVIDQTFQHGTIRFPVDGRSPTFTCTP